MPSLWPTLRVDGQTRLSYVPEESETILVHFADAAGVMCSIIICRSIWLSRKLDLQQKRMAADIRNMDQSRITLLCCKTAAATC